MGTGFVVHVQKRSRRQATTAASANPRARLQLRGEAARPRWRGRKVGITDAGPDEKLDVRA